MLKSKRAVISIAVGTLVVGLTLASMAISTTSGAGTDTTNPQPTLTSAPAATATPVVSAPPQSPIEPPAAAAAAPGNTGNQAGVGTLPSAGYGSADGGNQSALFLLVLAGLILTAGTALTLAGRMPGSRNK